MVIDFSHHEPLHHLGDSAMPPMAPHSWRHAALLVVAGTSLLPPRALPDTPITVPSGAFNCFF